ncbi:MAG: hypothetical protein Q8R78_07070 [Candidatus Omnitrophota bacterium]|nr:hypothetical protein [Candidatus Omnitrophota bacterium]
MKRSFTLFETVILVASIGLVSLIGARAHRWMWSQAELWHYRMTMQEVAGVVRQMRLRAVNARRTLTMRIDAQARQLQLMAADDAPLMQESVERTIWLPPGLEILQAPDQVTASPTGAMSPISIIIEAPAFQREFQLHTSPLGAVRLHEEPST